MTTTVVHLSQGNCVLICRPSKWGNPFVIGKDGTRAEVIEKYREYVLRRKDLMDQLESLRGKRLGCYCKPLACHGDVLVDLLEGPKNPAPDQIDLF